MKNISILNELQDSFAIILCNIIMSDNIVSEKEKEKFNIFFQNEFSLSPEETDTLFKKSMLNLNDLNLHIAQLKEGLEDSPTEKARFMKYLNECIICDGVDNREYQTFEEIRLKLF
jgi:uncharacterized tellurite resistance protein B-like protein